MCTKHNLCTTTFNSDTILIALIDVTGPYLFVVREGARIGWCAYDVIVGQIELFDKQCLVTSLVRIVLEKCGMRLSFFTANHATCIVIDNMPLLIVNLLGIDRTTVRKLLIGRRGSIEDVECVRLDRTCRTPENKCILLLQCARYVIEMFCGATKKLAFQ
jgi:hypothetical protein